MDYLVDLQRRSNLGKFKAKTSRIRFGINVDEAGKVSDTCEAVMCALMAYLALQNAVGKKEEDDLLQAMRTRYRFLGFSLSSEAA